MPADIADSSRIAVALEPITSRRPQCHRPVERGWLLPSASRASGVYQNGLRIAMRRYWQAGEDLNAMWPRLLRRGARTITAAIKEQGALARRRGRPKSGDTAPQPWLRAP